MVKLIVVGFLRNSVPVNHNVKSYPCSEIKHYDVHRLFFFFLEVHFCDSRCPFVDLLSLSLSLLLSPPPHHHTGIELVIVTLGCFARDVCFTP